MIILGLAGPKVQEQMATQTAADFFLRKTKSARSLLLPSLPLHLQSQSTPLFCVSCCSPVCQAERVSVSITITLVAVIVPFSGLFFANSFQSRHLCPPTRALGPTSALAATSVALPPSPPPPPPSSSARHISHLCSGRCILPRILCNIVATTRSHSLSIAQTPLQTLKRERKKEKALGHTTEHRTERTFFEVFVCLPLSVCVFIGALAAAIAEAVLLRTEHTEHTHSR